MWLWIGEKDTLQLGIVPSVGITLQVEGEKTLNLEISSILFLPTCKAIESSKKKSVILFC